MFFLSDYCCVFFVSHSPSSCGTYKCWRRHMNDTTKTLSLRPKGLDLWGPPRFSPLLSVDASSGPPDRKHCSVLPQTRCWHSEQVNMEPAFVQVLFSLSETLWMIQSRIRRISFNQMRPAWPSAIFGGGKMLSCILRIIDRPWSMGVEVSCFGAAFL